MALLPRGVAVVETLVQTMWGQHVCLLQNDDILHFSAFSNHHGDDILACAVPRCVLVSAVIAICGSDTACPCCCMPCCCVRCWCGVCTLYMCLVSMPPDVVMCLSSVRPPDCCGVWPGSLLYICLVAVCDCRLAALCTVALLAIPVAVADAHC